MAPPMTMFAACARCEKGEEALVIVGAVLGVDVEGDRMAGADGVQADAALEAGAGAPAELALHLVLGDEIGGADRHVQEAVDRLSLIVGAHGAELGPLAGEPEGFRHGVDRRPDHRMIDRLGHALAHEEHVHARARAARRCSRRRSRSAS